MRTWIKDPLAIFAEGAERGLVVEDGRIAEVGRQGRRAGGAGRRRFRRLAPRRAARPRQHASPFLPDADARPPGGDQPGAVSLADGALSDLGAAEAAPPAPRRAPRPDRIAAVGLHDGGGPSLSLPAGASRTPSTSRSRRRARSGMRMTVTRGSMNRSQKDGGLPPDSVVQDEDAILADSERVLKLFHDPEPGALIRIALAPCSPFSIDKRLMGETRGARRALRLPAAHPSLRDEGRGALLPGDVRRAAGRPPGGDRLDVEADVARARHSFQRRGDRPAGARRRRRLPLRGLQHGARLRDLPDLRARGGGRAGRARRRRLGLQRFLQHDGGGAPRADDRPAALRRCRRSRISTCCAGRPKARRAASGATTSAASRRACRPIWRCSRSTSRVSAARTIRSPRSCCAARTAPTG